MAERRWIGPLVRDVVLSLVVVAIVLGGLFAFSGLWPPMVVIESGSMQHSSTDSFVGVIDTGDLTVVRSLDREGSITTWVEGREQGYETYGDFGDVIVFHKNGITGTTPVIHRALVWIAFNSTTEDSFDIPSMGLFDVTGVTFQNLTSYHTGSPEAIDLAVDLDLVLRNFDDVKAPHGGFITKGDNNPQVDQVSLFVGDTDEPTTRRAEPVAREWVVGVSRGELPWFGVLKLAFSDDAGGVPRNSVHNLLLTCGLLVIIPTTVDLILTIGGPRLRSLVPRLRSLPRTGGDAEGTEPGHGVQTVNEETDVVWESDPPPTPPGGTS